MRPLATGLLALGAVASGGHPGRADPAPQDPAPKPSAPDPRAEQSAQEANLEPNGSREGTTFSATVGPGLIVATGKSDRVPTLSLRLGHVATPATIVMLEVAGGTFVHALGSTTYFDSFGVTLVGAQHYLTPSVWIRGAAGLGVQTVENAMVGRTAKSGPASDFGVGLDLVRRHYFVLGLELYSLFGINRDGLVMTSAFGLGLSYY